MKPSSKLRRSLFQMKMNPFLGPALAGSGLLVALLPWVGISPWWYAALLLWAALWAFLEHMAPTGHPRSRVRELTPNFYAVLDLAGCWRIYERPASVSGDCRHILQDILSEQRRLPASLTPGRYRALTHDTIVARLQGMANVKILNSCPAYVATLEATISGAMRGRCKRCSIRCPFPRRQQLRRFYDIRFQVLP